MPPSVFNGGVTSAEGFCPSPSCVSRAEAPTSEELEGPQCPPVGHPAVSGAAKTLKG